MRTRNKIVSVICVLAVLLSSMTIFASALTYETPVEPERWEEPSLSRDHAFSIAIVGDTQYLTNGDATQGTEKLKTQFKYIVDSAEERKLEHVFVIGDITNNGYFNDGNLATRPTYPGTNEWEIVKEAIVDQMAGMSYQVNRGNHDDYLIDHYFNVEEYTKQFEGCGDFYTDAEAKHPYSKESGNEDGWVHWNSIDGYYGNTTGSILNSYKTVNIYGVDYIFITVDYNPTDNVLVWLSETLSAFPNHRAIVTTHHYLKNDGTLADTYKSGTTHWSEFANYPNVIWDEVLSKHENVFMIVSGHVGAVNGMDLSSSINVGDHGNEVFQLMVNPQNYDYNHENSKGTQDTGLVLYMNFSADGKTVTFDYYSTLLNKSLSSAKMTFELDYKVTNFSADIKTKETASVKLSSIEKSGLRFKTAINTAELDALVEGYGKENVAVGTLIAPADLWTTKELRHANGIDNEDYIDVEATVGSPLETDGDYSIYAGSVINIKDRNYERDFIAVGYIKVITDDGPIYIYSDVVAQKSISEIAEAAYNDVWASQEGKYQHKIEDETDIHYGKYSKYSKEQRNVLYSYIANKDESKNDPFGSDKFD